MTNEQGEMIWSGQYEVFVRSLGRPMRCGATSVSRWAGFANHYVMPGNIWMKRLDFTIILIGIMRRR
ncbi:TPA: hypothetical protein ACSTL0_001484 [Serratia fonticola]